MTAKATAILIPVADVLVVPDEGQHLVDFLSIHSCSLVTLSTLQCLESDLIKALFKSWYAAPLENKAV